MSRKVYTKTGDAGETSLIGGTRVRKNDLRVSAYGSVDELNSFVGLLNSFVLDHMIKLTLDEIQRFLFKVGADLATDKSKKPSMLLPDEVLREVKFLENLIDEMEVDLPELRNFILPSGSSSVTTAHCCRSITRRVERALYDLREKSEVDDKVLIYINRLSDFFFVLSRYLAYISGELEKKI